jgi:hypothetical protein
MTKNTLSTKGELVEFPAVREEKSQAISPQAREDFEQGMQHLQAGDAAEAVVALSRCVETAPGFTQGHMFLGIAHALTYSIYPAIDHLEIAAKLDRASFAAHFTLAQLNFKLRIPQKGYEAAKDALRCVTTLEQRKMLTQLLKEERVRENNGIARPWFNKPFSRPALFLAGSGLAAAILFAIAHVH